MTNIQKKGKGKIMSTLLATFQSTGLLDTITSAVSAILYPAFGIIFLVIRLIQSVFYSFAGIGNVRFGSNGFQAGQLITSENTGNETDTGLVYYLLNSDFVKEMLISMIALSVVLIIIFTTMAFIKNVYAAKPKNWKEIVGNAIKGLANFIILPVCVLLGVWLGNILLQAINGATSKGGATSMDRKLFIASAYNANMFRVEGVNDKFRVTWGDLEQLIQNKMQGKVSFDSNNDGVFEKVEGVSFKDYYGIDLDYNEVNANDPVISEREEAQAATSETKMQKLQEKKDYYANLVDQVFAETDVDIVGYGLKYGVANFYSLWQVNYIVLGVGGAFMLFVLGSISFAMVKRLIYLIILFIISPAVCAMYPLDEGNAVKSWSGEVKKQVLSAYGAVAGMNLFFSIIPLLDKISVVGGLGGTGLGINDILQLFILVCGLLVVKDLINMITGFVGGDNAYSTGSSLWKATTGALKEKGGGNIKKGVGVFSKGYANFKHYGFKGGLGRNVGDLANWAGAKTTGLNLKEDIKDSWKAGVKGVEDKKKEDDAKKESKEFAKEFEKLWDKQKVSLTEVDEDGDRVASAKGIAEYMKSASQYGIEDKKSMSLLQEYLKKFHISKEGFEIKKLLADYAEQQEDEKMRRMATYNNMGKELETMLDADVVKINSAKSEITTAQGNIQDSLSNPKRKILDDAIALAKENENRKGNTKQGSHGKGLTRREAIKMMETSLETGELDSNLNSNNFKGDFKKAVDAFIDGFEEAKEAISGHVAATQELKAAQEREASARKSLAATLDVVEKKFGGMGEDIKKLSSTTEGLEDAIEEIKKKMKS